MNGTSNPPAFPNYNLVGVTGMTLRDWLAGQVIATTWQQATIMGNTGRLDEEHVPQVAAGIAYLVADAALAERAKVRS